MSQPCGINNIGNTCYMNSVLQLLAHNNILFNYMTSQEYSEDLLNNIMTTKKTTELANDEMQKEVSYKLSFQLIKILEGMQKTQPIVPLSFKQLLSIKNNTFIGSQQNDAHELLVYLMDCIHEETKCQVVIKTYPQVYHTIEKSKEHYNNLLKCLDSKEEKMKVFQEYEKYAKEHQKEFLIYNGIVHWKNYIGKNYSIITKHFTGMYLSGVRCTKCNAVFPTYECYNTIQLSIADKPNVTLNDCLQKYVQLEVMDENNKYECHRCKEKVVCEKQMTFWHLPDILIINLKRFRNDGEKIHKIDTLVSYTQNLNLQPYVSEFTDGSHEYILTDVVHHYGSYNGGHYTEFSKIGNEWYWFNDAKVSKLDSDGFEKEIMTNASYILVYSKKL